MQRLKTISVVIPALNAESSIARAMGSVSGAGEIIVVDGGSDDGTVILAEGLGARVLVAARGRGNQLHAGARVAKGEWLLFLHADTRLSRDWTLAVDSHLSRSEEPACFGFRLESEAWQARLVERGVAMRMRLFSLPYGDQGLLLPRRLYDAVGGYRPLPLMEDVDLVRRLGRIRLLQADAVTSAEKWQRQGWLRRSVRNLLCLASYKVGVPIERIARSYD